MEGEHNSSMEETQAAWQAADAARQEKVDANREHGRAAYKDVAEVMAMEPTERMRHVDDLRRWLESQGRNTADMDDEGIVHAVYYETHPEARE